MTVVSMQSRCVMCDTSKTVRVCAECSRRLFQALGLFDLALDMQHVADSEQADDAMWRSRAHEWADRLNKAIGDGELER